MLRMLHYWYVYSITLWDDLLQPALLSCYSFFWRSFTYVCLQIEELELSKIKATDLLKAHDGDASKALRAYIAPGITA